MTPVPWPLIGRTAPAAAPYAPDREATGTRYPAPGPVAPGTRLWLIAEAATLAALADAGGDLHAHRTVHLEDR